MTLHAETTLINLAAMIHVAQLNGDAAQGLAMVHVLQNQLHVVGKQAALVLISAALPPSCIMCQGAAQVTPSVVQEGAFQLTVLAVEQKPVLQVARAV